MYEIDAQTLGAIGSLLTGLAAIGTLVMRTISILRRHR